MCVRCGIILVLLCFSLSAVTQPVPGSYYSLAKMQQFRVTDAGNGRKTSLPFNSSSKQLFLLVFLSPECPLCQQYSLNLNQLASAYEASVSLVGIVPGKSYGRKAVTDFTSKYRISFPVFIDEDKSVSNYLRATVTPEVMLLEKNTGMLSLVYSGAIDDRLKGLGKSRVHATTDYAKDAIELTLQKKTVVIKRTDPVGCLINDY